MDPVREAERVTVDEWVGPELLTVTRPRLPVVEVLDEAPDPRVGKLVDTTGVPARSTGFSAKLDKLRCGRGVLDDIFQALRRSAFSSQWVLVNIILGIILSSSLYSW